MINQTTFAGLPQALPQGEELELFRQDRENPEVRNKLLLHALRDSLKYAATCCEGKIPYDELMSLCTNALIQAIRNYDLQHESGLTLIQFSKPYIRGEIRRYWKRLNVVNYGTKLPADTSTEQLENVPQFDYQDPDFEGIHMRERWEWVKPHFDKLSETERRVLVLLFESRFTLAEVGRMLDCTRENIRTTKNRALMKIRKGLYCKRKLFAE